jgi:hypothetical protein
LNTRQYKAKLNKLAEHGRTVPNEQRDQIDQNDTNRLQE